MYEKEIESKFAKFVDGLDTAEIRALYMLYLRNGVRKLIEDKLNGKR